MSIAKRIRSCRVSSDLTQTALADLVGVTRSAVAQWESGEIVPRRDMMAKIAEALSESRSWLEFGGDAEPDAQTNFPPISKFWMVYGVGQRAPAFQHASLHQAETEAKRLAISNPGIKFVVLEAVEAFKAEKPRVVTIGVTELDDIPF
jgi:transcriptional regulator with XRE-family HTH domain